MIGKNSVSLRCFFPPLVPLWERGCPARFPFHFPPAGRHHLFGDNVDNPGQLPQGHRADNPARFTFPGNNWETKGTKGIMANKPVRSFRQFPAEKGPAPASQLVGRAVPGEPLSLLRPAHHSWRTAIVHPAACPSAPSSFSMIGNNSPESIPTPFAPGPRPRGDAPTPPHDGTKQPPRPGLRGRLCHPCSRPRD